MEGKTTLRENMTGKGREGKGMGREGKGEGKVRGKGREGKEEGKGREGKDVFKGKEREWGNKGISPGRLREEISLLGD